MDTLPGDIVTKISNELDNFEDLLNFKLTCLSISLCVSNFSLLRFHVKNIYNRNPKWLTHCANIYCYDDTLDIYENFYREYSGRYIHYHQPAFNKQHCTINKKSHLLFTPYCAECFKKYVLIGDLDWMKYTCVNIEDEIIVDFD